MPLLAAKVLVRGGRLLVVSSDAEQRATLSEALISASGVGREMRAALPIVVLLAACDGGAPRPVPTGRLDAGEDLGAIAPGGQPAASMRSGPQVPVRLPPGFTLYPGGQTVTNTLFERGGKQRVLLVFVTPDPVEEVMRYYRAEARAAGMTVELDLGSGDRASLGGTLRSGGGAAISARRENRMTRVEFAHYQA